jgi:hypothetical protein
VFRIRILEERHAYHEAKALEKYIFNWQP